MCDAVSAGMALGGLALSGGGTLARQQGESAVKSARSGVAGAENTRQVGFESQSQNLFKDSLGQAAKDKQEADTQAAADKRTVEATARLEQAPDPTNPSDVTGDNSGVVKSSNARELIKALNLGKLRARRAGDVNAYGDNNMNVGFGLARNGMRQGQVGSAAQRSAALLPGEYANANHAGDGFNALGDALSAAGTVVGTAGAFGAGSGLESAWGGLFDATPVVGAAPAGGFKSIDSALETMKPRGFFPRTFRPSV